MLTLPTVHISPTNVTLRAAPLTCDSSHVVYILKCSLCPDVYYVGQTATAFRMRFNNHKSSIRLKRAGCPVGEHLNLPNHDLKCLQFALIRGNLVNHNKRILYETQLILRTASHIHGLNKDIAFFSIWIQLF